jgi:integrase
VTHSKNAHSAKVKIVPKRLADGSIKEYYYSKNEKPATPSPSGRFAEGTIGAVTIELRQSHAFSLLAKRTKQNYALHLQTWEHFASHKMSEVRRADILKMRYRVALEDGPGAATVWTNITSRLFSFALDRSYIEYNPCVRLPPIPLGSIQAWNPADAKLAIERLPDYMTRIVILGMYTGVQRRGDLIKMCWSDIGKRLAGTIYVRQQKIGRELDIPIHPRLSEYLAIWRVDADENGTILLNASGSVWDAESMTQRVTEEMQGLGRAGLSPHGLRKLAAANLATAGCITHEIMSITGHTTLKMVEIYTNSANTERLAKSAMEKLGNYDLETAPVSTGN